MRILISNDDGVDSPGIKALAKAMMELGEVTVVAPHRERSTASHSLTLHKPLRIYKLDRQTYSTTGSPADCIYLGIRQILKAKPDLIVSGINAGANLGTDVHYSGTVAAAREGALVNIPSYAFSMVALAQTVPDYPSEPFRFDMAAETAKQVVEQTINADFPAHCLLNVNIPNMDNDRIQGVRITRQGFRYYSSEVARGIDPRGRDYYWIGGSYSGYEKTEGTDCFELNAGWVTVTPISIDGTHNKFYTTLKEREQPTE